MAKIKMIPKNESANYSLVDRTLDFRGDKVGGGFTPDDVETLAGTDIQLYVISQSKGGAPQMLPVISTSTKDAWKIDDPKNPYDPGDYNDGQVLVTKDAIAPFPANWLTLDDPEYVYVNASDLEQALKAIRVI